MIVAELSFQTEDVSSLFSSLFPVPVEVIPLDHPQDGSSDLLTAIYRNGDDELAAVCQVDFEFAARSAAALTMIPAGGCNEVIASRKLDENYLENAHEVMNLVSILISLPESKRVFLSNLVGNGEELPGDVADMVKAGHHRSTLKVNFGNYGDGVISLFG